MLALPVPPLQLLEVVVTGAGKVDRATEDIQDTAIDMLASQLAQFGIHLLRIPAPQVTDPLDAEIVQILRDAGSDARYRLQIV